MRAQGCVFRFFCVCKRVGYSLRGGVCRFLLWWLLLGLQILLPASGAVTITFHPNYHLEDIQTLIDPVANDGLHAAEFSVKVRDHRNLAIPDVEVDWSVEKDANAEVFAGITDGQGDSYALLRSQIPGTFKVKASWHNKLGNISTAESWVTFMESQPLNFLNKAVNVKFDQSDPAIQLVSGGNGEDGGGITFSSSCPEVADFDETAPERLILKKVGVTMITATEAGSEKFSEQSASYILNVEKATGDPPEFKNQAGEIEVAFDKKTLENTATSKHGGSITYTSDRTDVATVDDPAAGKVTLTAVGTARITATENADNYEPASASYILNVEKATGTPPEFTDQAGKIEVTFDKKTLTNVAKKKHGGSITYTSDRTDVAKFNDPAAGEVTLVGVGTARITATEVADNYEPASASYMLEVAPAKAASISFKPDKMSKMESDSSFPVSLTGASDGADIIYKSDRETVAQVNSSGDVTLGLPGVAKIIARQRLKNYGEETAELELTVNPKPLTVQVKDSPTIGDVEVVCDGEKNKEIKLVWNDSDYKTQDADENGLAKFALTFETPKKTERIKCVQGERQAEKLLKVEDYIVSVKPAFFDFGVDDECWFGVIVSAKIREHLEGSYPCYPDWDVYGTGHGRSCRKHLTPKGGMYNDLVVTPSYTEKLSKRNHYKLELVRVSVSIKRQHNGDVLSKLVHTDINDNFRRLIQSTATANNVDVIGEGYAHTLHLFLFLDLCGEKSGKFGSGEKYEYTRTELCKNDINTGHLTLETNEWPGLKEMDQSYVVEAIFID